VCENDVDARASVPLRSYATGFLFFGKKFDGIQEFRNSIRKMLASMEIVNKN
jgi:hypothetical protein